MSRKWRLVKFRDFLNLAGFKNLQGLGKNHPSLKQ